jgi:ankyrin repeat protein
MCAWDFDRGHTQTCAMLIEHKADVNKVKATSGRTALHFASEAGHTDTFLLLIKQGADINAPSCVRGDGGVWRGDHRTALICAAASGQTHIVEMLINGVQVAKRTHRYVRSLRHLVFTVHKTGVPHEYNNLFTVPCASTRLSVCSIKYTSKNMQVIF